MRLIDADEILKKQEHFVNALIGEMAIVFVEDIENAPTISPDSLRPKGLWIDRPSVKGQVYCSECATIEKVTDSNYKSRSCPNCGADMRGDDEHG